MSYPSEKDGAPPGPLTDVALDQLFGNARSSSYWLDKPVGDEMLRQLCELMKWGATSANGSPAQKKAPNTQVVKAFNTVFAEHMDTGRLGNDSLTTLVAGDDPDAKRSVLEIASAIGFDAVDSGPLGNARAIEALKYLNIQLGHVLGMGTKIGFKLLRAENH